MYRALFSFFFCVCFFFLLFVLRKACLFFSLLSFVLSFACLVFLLPVFSPFYEIICCPQNTFKISLFKSFRLIIFSFRRFAGAIWSYL